MKKIFIFFFCLVLFFLSLSFTKSALAYDCTNRNPAGFDGSNPCNPLDTTKYPQCRSSGGYSDCVSVSGCRFFESSSSITGYCAYNSNSGSAPVYTCTNRDPKCPTTTHDCMIINPTTPFDCSPSSDCLSLNYSTGTKYCAYPKGTTPPQWVTPTPPPYTQGNFDCSNRMPGCSSATDFPSCNDFSYSSSWSCQPPNCAMQNTYGSDSTRWTHSCAYSKDQPPATFCRPAGDRFCTGTTGSQGDCCANLICEAPGANHTALGDGTCVGAPSNLGPSCNTCLPGDKWNATKNSCVDSSGNITNPVSQIYCQPTETCTQGLGCIIANPTLPPNSYGGAFGGESGLFSCGNKANAIWTLDCIFPTVANLITWLLEFTGVIAIIIIIFAGIRITTSNGDPKTVILGRKMLEFAIIGLVVVFLSFFIVRFIASTTGLVCIDPRHSLSFTSCR